MLIDHSPPPLPPLRFSFSASPPSQIIGVALYIWCSSSRWNATFWLLFLLSRSTKT
ncbi:unnamed protein product [Brassica oleracea]